MGERTNHAEHHAQPFQPAVSRRFLSALRRETTRLAASRADRAMLTWAPVLGVLLLAWIFSAGTPTRLPIGVLDADGSTLSRQLTRWLAATPGLAVTEAPANARSAEQLLRAGRVHAVLAIPPDFSADLKRGRATRVALLDNAQRGVHSGLIQKDVLTVVTTLSAGIEIVARQKRGESPAAAAAHVEPLRSATISLFNTAPDYARFLGAALVAALLHVLAMSTGAWAVGRELREGTLPGWLGVAEQTADAAPAQPSRNGAGLAPVLAALLAKLAWPWLSFSVVGALALAWLTVGRGWPVPGSLLLVAAAHAAFVALSLLLGALFTLLASSQRMGLSAAGFVAAPALAFSGVAFPGLALPVGAQWWALALPLTHYLQVQVQQLLMGAPLRLSLTTPLVMLALCVPLAGLAAALLRRAAGRPELWGKR